MDDSYIHDWVLFMVEVMHTKYHMDGEKDAHGFCGRQEWVKDLQRQVDNY